MTNTLIKAKITKIFTTMIRFFNRNQNILKIIGIIGCSINILGSLFYIFFLHDLNFVPNIIPTFPFLAENLQFFLLFVRYSELLGFFMILLGYLSFISLLKSKQQILMLSVSIALLLLKPGYTLNPYFPMVFYYWIWLWIMQGRETGTIFFVLFFKKKNFAKILLGVRVIRIILILPNLIHGFHGNSFKGLEFLGVFERIIVLLWFSQKEKKFPIKPSIKDLVSNESI
jgi:hypothetical protein